MSKNDALSIQRAAAVKAKFEPELRKALKGYAVDFKYDMTPANDDVFSGTAVVIGTSGRGQRDSIVAAGGNKFANDPRYKKVELSVRVAVQTTENHLTRVRRRFGYVSTTTHWSVSVAGGIGFYVGASCGYLLVKLTNMYHQEAVGSAYVCGPGVQATLPDLDFGRLAASATFSDDTDFTTEDAVDFVDFDLRRIRYTSATIGLFAGYNWSYLSFSNMGSGAQHIKVGGVSLGGADIGLSATTGVGLLKLHTVPPDYVVDTFDVNKWETTTSDSSARHTLTTYFPTESAVLSGDGSDIRRFAADVASDILD